MIRHSGRRGRHRHDPAHLLFDVDADKIVFPIWAPVGTALLATILGVGVAADRGAISSPDWSTVFVLLATVPWILDVVVYLKGSRSGIPLPLFNLMVLAGVLGLLLDPVTNDYTPFFLVMLCAEMAARVPPRKGVLVLIGSMAVIIACELANQFEGSFIWVIGIAFGWAGGFGCQMCLRLLQEMKASQDTLVEKAAAEERQRIAREIHDVIAHTLSVTMLHVTGARLALERGNREDAVDALRDAERSGRESLGEIRRTVSVLGSDGTGTDAPMPTATDLPDLVAGFRAAGLDVDLDVHGDPAGLPPALGLGVYRIAQESLTNVAKHAPDSHTDVRLSVEPERVRLVVRDVGDDEVAAPVENGGLGLRGMRERAAALGGSVDARPNGTGWTVDATLPRADPALPSPPGGRRRGRC